ncbi:MAG: TrmH family RNA methyltransferase [Tenericutes bacterium]|nr:TrmH family RNA methyltransferase [Mycoplasmatota bacterium]
MKRYEKDMDYSYTLGIFPTIELLNRKIIAVSKIIFSSEINKDIENKIIELCNNKIEYTYDDKLIKKISDKENCYVIGIFNKYYSNLDLNEPHVVLVNPSNMGNVGTIIRTMLGFNYKNLAIITPSVDIFNPKVIRASMGSIFGVSIKLFSSFDEYKETYNKHKIYTFMTDGKLKLNEIEKDNLVSLVFGNESSGLDESYKKYESVVINHSNEIDSLNLTIAIGISLYEFSLK